MANYFDTSALCRHYHSEPGSAEVDQLLADDTATQYVSWLTVLEAQSAFALKVRTGAINAANLATLRSRLFADIDHKRLLVVRVLRRHYDRADELLVNYGPSVRLRTLDALHLAIALSLQERGLAQRLITADTAMVTVAIQEGLTVFNPLSPT